jgi:hypothetical protein
MEHSTCNVTVRTRTYSPVPRLVTDTQSSPRSCRTFRLSHVWRCELHLYWDFRNWTVSDAMLRPQQGEKGNKKTAVELCELVITRSLLSGTDNVLKLLVDHPLLVSWYTQQNYDHRTLPTRRFSLFLLVLISAHPRALVKVVNPSTVFGT